MSPEVMVARWTAARLARLVGADLDGDPSPGIDTVTTDSRMSREGTAFFALDGTRVRGADFASAAFGSGCSAVVVPRDWEGEIPPGRAALRHDDPLRALGLLAASVRAGWECPVLAVTGSSGKTTVKEMIAHLLGGVRAVHRSPGNFNTLEGLARSLLEVPDPPGLAVLEIGASRPGEIARLAEIVRPSAAGVTNVGPAHLEGFTTLERVAREKVALLEAVPREGLRVIDGDDGHLAAAVTGLRGGVLRCGLGADNDLRAVDVTPLPDGTTRFRLADGRGEGTLPLPGEHQVRNALLALALTEPHGVPVEEGLARLATFPGVPGRLGLVDFRGILVADDTYNANPASMRVALDWFDGLEVAGRKAVVLGDMLELGADSRRYHEDLGRRVGELAPDLAVFVGEESRAAFEEGKRRMGDGHGLRHVPDSDEAARLLRRWAVPGDAVLVKGSRGMRMERVVRALGGEEANRDAL